MIEGHGDDLYRYEHLIRYNFSSNLTNWIDPTPLKNYLRDKVDQVVTAYPEPQPSSLEARLAQVYGVVPEAVCVTSGATEAIYLIAHAHAGAQSVVLQPTFSEYADACRMHGHQVQSCYQLPAHDMLSGQVRLLWLCNPNNPTGQVCDKAQLLHMIECNPNVVFVVDQSYEDFTNKPLLSVAESAILPNVLLLHSLTKRFAMPGLRLGYVTGNPVLLEQLRLRRMPWSVNGVALLAGKFLAGHPERMPFDLAACLMETEHLRQQLMQTKGVEVWPTHTHFMLVKLRRGRTSALKAFLVERYGILIRDASNFEGLDEACFRISTQRPQDNALLVKAIQHWLEY